MERDAFPTEFITLQNDEAMIKVLTVDDAGPVRAILRGVFKTLPSFSTVEAETGFEATEILRSQPIDIVITDWNMPDMTGLDLVHSIRNGDYGIDCFLPIIMLTGHGEYANVIEARDAGADEFVVKPLTVRSLFLRIDAVIHNRRDFIRCGDFFGPDRRRRDLPYHGPDRRRVSAVYAA